MTKLHILGLLLGLAVAIYGIYAMIVGESSGFIFIFGGIVIMALAAGVFKKSGVKDQDDAG